MSVSSYDPDEQPPDPRTHICKVRDINYDRALKGQITCHTCGAEWNLDPKTGWKRHPQPTPRRFK